ncbi:ribonuclease R family protein [Leptospira sp. GIMC2001]|uniref:ribonuclease R family protein n=1 Tax=Leptospira sp. GIMC2001 TaxID=1513297 RepID=UPI00234A9B0A|nr:ribonuclease R family protein [Leptospira sp. GIMC2001]WCL49548.1 ribonuclease R [Leptospira sp. GIMC2001]
MENTNYQITRKIIDYIASFAGAQLTKQDIIKKFLPDTSTDSKAKTKTSEKSKKKAKPKPSPKTRDKAKERLNELENLLFLLEAEGLIKIEKKTIFPKRPFSVSGKISLSLKGDGFVKLPSGNETFIPGSKTDTAIAGDLVEIYPIGVGRKDRIEGEVIRILKRGRVLYRMKVVELQNKGIIGKLLDMSGEEKEGFLLKKSLLEDVLKNIKVGDVLIVKMKDAVNTEPNLYDVSFVRFESDSKEDPDFMRVLMKYNYNQNHPDTIPLDYPEEINSETVSDWESRVDLTNLYSVTIDGATAKDFDDALSYVDEGKRKRFWVHIADVSYYVREGSVMDEEAYERATSVYLSNRVVPMLPPILSEGLCSLVANTNRLAFTVEMEADSEGNIFASKFYKSIIKVSKRYTYEMAEDEIIENKPDNWMVQLNHLAESMRRNRMKAGRVDLNVKENIIEIGSDFLPVSITSKERLKSHMLVEEMMLSANTKVAEFLKKKKAPALNRIHEVMEGEKLEALNAYLKLNSINLQLETPDYEQIRKILEKLHGNPNEKVFNYLLLRSFMQAYYGPEYTGHWGLGFQDYCHFTSPIRRYPDLVVHRVLHSVLLNEPAPYDWEKLKGMGIHCSEQERRAADAERDIFKLKACRYLQKTGILKFWANITGYKPNFVFVELDDPSMEAVIDKSEFTNEFELLGRNPFSFYSKKYTKDFVLGERIHVMLDHIDYENIKVYVKVLGW